MTTFIHERSLLEKFQSLFTKARRTRPIRCHGITNKKARCQRRIQATKKALSVLYFDIIELLERGNGDIEHLLAQAAPLIMCTQHHQGYAATQVKIWMESITFLEDQLPPTNDGAKPILPLSPTSLSKCACSSASSSDELKAEATITATLNIEHPPLTPSKESTSQDLNFFDSGYQSIEGQEAEATSPALDLPAVEAGSVSVPNPYVTPKKAPSTVTPDSGVSLSSESPDRISEAIDVEPTSPSARRSTRLKRHPTYALLSRPAANPIQPKPSKKAKSPDPPLVKPSPRTFQYFKHPAKELIDYIKQPLGDIAKKEGYIYTFQLEKDWNLNKIGSTAQGKHDDTIEDALERRMRQHRYCGWSEPKCVLKCQMPHAQRVEHIIGKHLGYRKVEECDMFCGKNGKTCKHEIHREWFKVSLETIYEIVWAWKRWIRTNPYVEKDGEYKLSSEWELRLKEVLKIDPNGKDCWLEWLNRFAPADTQMHVVNSPGPGDVDRNKISSITTAIVETSSGEHDGETPNFPKPPLRERGTFINRLKPAGTWPRFASKLS